MRTILTRGNLLLYSANKRDTKDNRKKVAWAVFSYYDKKGTEYRKSFTAKINTPENEFFNIAPSELILITNK